MASTGTAHNCHIAKSGNLPFRAEFRLGPVENNAIVGRMITKWGAMAVERDYVVDIRLSIEGPWFETTWVFSVIPICLCMSEDTSKPLVLSIWLYSRRSKISYTGEMWTPFSLATAEASMTRIRKFC